MAGGAHQRLQAFSQCLAILEHADATSKYSATKRLNRGQDLTSSSAARAASNSASHCFLCSKGQCLCIPQSVSQFAARQSAKLNKVWKPQLSILGMRWLRSCALPGHGLARMHAHWTHTVAASVASTAEDSSRPLCISLTLSYSACCSFRLLALSSILACRWHLPHQPLRLCCLPPVVVQGLSTGTDNTLLAAVGPG